MKMKFHPISRIFPPIEGEEFDALVKSIKEKGLLNPIWLHPEGSIIDGRNRYRACKKAGVAPRYQKWNGKGWQAWYPGLTRFKDGERTEANGPTSCPQAPRLATPVVAQLRMELGTLALETAEKVRTSDFLEGDNEN